MQYVLTTDGEDGIAELSKRLLDEIGAGKRVLWLLSGGSNIAPAVAIMDLITPEASQHLTLLLVDERYGPVDHINSNCKQLIDCGFDQKLATVITVLQPNMSFSDTRKHYNDAVAKAFADHDVVIAQLGIGSDGHIAGIIPGSSASTEDTQLVAQFHHDPFDRLTLTFPALRQIDVAYVFAFGTAKYQPLANLHDKNLPLTEQPAQILKQLPEVYIFNDQIGEL